MLRSSSKAASIALIALFLVLAAPALGSRKPTSAELKDITSQVRGFYSDWYYPQGSMDQVHVGSVRISTANPDWAVAHVSGPTSKGRAALSPDHGTVLLWRATGSPNVPGPSGAASRRWIVAYAGFMAEYAWCGIAPQAVTVDLLHNGNYGC
jgi:hypothetical protein